MKKIRSHPHRTRRGSNPDLGRCRLRLLRDSALRMNDQYRDLAVVQREVADAAQHGCCDRAASSVSRTRRIGWYSPFARLSSRLFMTSMNGHFACRGAYKVNRLFGYRRSRLFMMANMQLPQLEAFAETARLGNVSRAAEMLNLTQPALTARLQGLEGDLGVDLFVRGARGMTLTDAGRALLPYAQRVLAQVIEGRKAVQDLRGGKVGELLIGAAPAVSTYFLPGVLKTYQATHRDVRLGVRTGHTEEVLEMVLRREVDVGVGRPIRHPDVTLIPLFDDELVLVASRAHPFARRGKVRLQELGEDRLILFDRASSYYDLTSSLLRQAGVVPESVIELDNVEAAKKMVIEGLGVALLPRMALLAELRARLLRPVRIIGAPPVRRPIVAIRRADAGPPMGPVADFLAMLGTRG